MILSEQVNPPEIPQDTQKSLPIALLRAREAVMAGFRPVLARHGVTEQQWRVLRVLSEFGEALDASNLASRASILPPSLTRILKVLSERQMVKATKDQGDGRRVLVSILDAGEELIHKVAPESREIYADLERRYGAEKVESLLEMLDELTIKLAR